MIRRSRIISVNICAEEGKMMLFLIIYLIIFFSSAFKPSTYLHETSLTRFHRLQCLLLLCYWSSPTIIIPYSFQIFITWGRTILSSIRFPKHSISQQLRYQRWGITKESLCLNEWMNEFEMWLKTYENRFCISFYFFLVRQNMNVGCQFGRCEGSSGRSVAALRFAII